MKFRNFTPHDVVVYAENGIDILMTIPSDGCARTVEDCTVGTPVCGIPTVIKNYCQIEGLPEYDPDCIDIVSLIVLQSSIDRRKNLVCPDTGPDSIVRDEKGRFIGVRRFQIY